jgi:hypothetical protein
MDIRKPSRVITVNYNYRILENKTFKFIEESRPNTDVTQDHRWNIDDLIHKSVDQMSKQIFWTPKTITLESFQRTKIWLENHPELLL